MLDANIKTQLKAYLDKVTQPIELVASLDEGDKSGEMRALLGELAELSDKITVVESGAPGDQASERKPSFALARRGEPGRVRFAGLPMGHEFSSLILALGGWPRPS